MFGWVRLIESFFEFKTVSPKVVMLLILQFTSSVFSMFFGVFYIWIFVIGPFLGVCAGLSFPSLLVESPD